jgi:nicotinamidase-related amidase
MLSGDLSLIGERLPSLINSEEAYKMVHLDKDLRHTAVIICDMWDSHYCKGATARVAEMAPRMNQTVKKLRDLGAQIIHAPSDTMDFYKNFAARKRALNAPPVHMEIPLIREIHYDPATEGIFPIDPSDEGCGCSAKCTYGTPHRHQIDLIDIDEECDAISDHFDAIYLMKQLKIEHVIIMGVHTNYCILARPFGIRQLVKQGFDVALMRDLTDALYYSEMPSFIDNFTATDLVVDFIERCGVQRLQAIK